MKKIIIDVNDFFLLQKKKFYILEDGSGVMGTVSSHGKLICSNIFVSKNDIVFNYFCFFSDNLNLDVEIIALKKITLREITISDNTKETIYLQIISQLIQKSVFDFYYHLYDSQGYMLAILENLCSNEKVINKKLFRPEYFNIGKTQFYKLYKKIKTEGFIKQTNDKLYLNSVKTHDYLSRFK